MSNRLLKTIDKPEPLCYSTHRLPALAEGSLRG
jgi:hypothetical protein